MKTIALTKVTNSRNITTDSLSILSVGKENKSILCRIHIAPSVGRLEEFTLEFNVDSLKQILELTKW